MPEYKFELEMSDYYNTRAQLLKSNGIPKLSDVKKNLGNVAAKVVYDQCEKALREDFGLKVPLKGPGDMLWISPSDLLIGKVALKPPFTPKCLQALTHQGILEIGTDLENKFKMEMEAEKHKSLEAYKAELLASVEDRMKSNIKDVEIKQKLACHIELEKQHSAFEIQLKEELDKLEIKIREQYEATINENELSLKTKWEEKLKKEVKKTVDTMTKEFIMQLDEQEAQITEMFKEELRKQEYLRNFDAKLATKKHSEALRQLKHNLECTNLVNMMYVLCVERRKCCDQKKQIEETYKREIKKLEEKITQKDKLIAKITTEKQKEIKNVSIRETCLLEVIKQFQKFINFALRAAPTQAEFLLSVEKMMVFELTKEVAKAQVPKQIPAGPILPWTYESSSKDSSAEELEITDHHNCFNEHYPPTRSTKVELDLDDTLPAIYFKKKTYIREDFRDMLSSGVPPSPSNELWNKDVEILVNNWREQMQEELKAEEDFEINSLNHEWTTKQVDVDQESRRRSIKSAVQFIDATQPSVSVARQSVRSSLDSRKMLFNKSSLKAGAIPFVEYVNLAPVPVIRAESTILAARDSIEILVEKNRKSFQYHPPDLEDSSRQNHAPSIELANEELEEHSTLPSEVIAENKFDEPKEIDVITTKDSLIMRLSEMAKKQQSNEFFKSPRDSIELTKEFIEEKEHELKKKPSKLLSTRNSIELLRKSLHKLKEPSIICQKKDQKMIKETKDSLQMSFSGTCCDRCKRKEESLENAVLTDTTRDDIISKPTSLMGSDERSVKISQIQIINLDEYVPTPSVVSFNAKPIYLYENLEPKSPTMTTLRKKSTKKHKKIAKKIQVVGDKEAKEGNQSNEVFTAERIHSLIQLMKDQPDLLRLFTSGSQL